ncbi:RnfH family protein [Herbaspirillum rubrisubalbicans]|uniref:RnfH family protein n=1 Tax=Herbaspirillum rubrisubalbicans TaxID=80842 RepID=UPI003B8A6703
MAQAAPSSKSSCRVACCGKNDIDLSVCKVGIFGKVKTLETPVRERDRIEIYRPLIADPKQSRRRRAAHQERVDGQ